MKFRKRIDRNAKPIDKPDTDDDHVDLRQVPRVFAETLLKHRDALANVPEAAASVERSLARVRNDILIAEQKKALLEAHRKAKPTKRYNHDWTDPRGLRDNSTLRGSVTSDSTGMLDLGNGLYMRELGNGMYDLNGVASISNMRAEAIGLSDTMLQAMGWHRSYERNAWINPRATQPASNVTGQVGSVRSKGASFSDEHIEEMVQKLYKRDTKGY